MAIIIICVLVWALWKFGGKAKNEPDLITERIVSAPHKTYSDIRKNQPQLSKMNNENDLASYTIEVMAPSKPHYSFDAMNTNFENKKQYTTEAGNKCWIPKGQSVEVAGITLPHGMVYVGETLKATNNNWGKKQENCLIVPSQSVAKSFSANSNEELWYWPSYSEISPQCRREYLEWLADGAKDPKINVGYVFLYFYGLERRLFFDRSKEEAEEVLSEIRRLMEVYGENRSIRWYFSQALAFGELLEDEIKLPPLEMPDHQSWELPINIQYVLGKKLKAGEPLVAEDLLIWFLHHSGSSYSRTPAQRLKSQFIALTHKRLEKVYQHGLKPRTPKKKLKANYKSASNTFNADFSDLLGDIPDIKSLNSPMAHTQKIVDGVMDDLDALSRFLGKNPNKMDSLQAVALLPEEIREEFGGTAANAFVDWLGDNQLPTLHDLVSKLGQSVTQITKTAYRDIEQVINGVGWNMIPSYGELVGSAKPEMRVLLRDKAHGGLSSATFSPIYLLALLEVTLGATVAHADKHVLDQETTHLKAHIERIPALNLNERTRLHHFVDWLEQEKPNLASLKSKLKSVDKSSKAALCEIGIAIAAADGRIAPEEVKVLEEVFRAAGMEQADLYSSLHAMGGQKSTQKTSKVKGHNDSAITLDRDKINETLQDTAKASHLLSSIFIEENLPSIQSEDANESDPQDTQVRSPYAGLDRTHGQLLQKLLEQSEWPRAAYQKLAAEYQLLADGAMEVINEWAYDTYGDALLEDNDPILVYKEIMLEAA